MEQPPAEPPPPESDPASGGSARAVFGERIATLRGPDLILVVGSVLYVACTFLPWYEATIGPLSVTDGAWNVGALGVLAALFGIATAAVAVAASIGVWKIGPQSAALLEVALAPATLFFTFLRMVIDPPGAAITRFTLGFVKVGRGFGLWGRGRSCDRDDSCGGSEAPLRA